MTSQGAHSAPDAEKFDARRDSFGSWELAINVIRERCVRSGEFAPHDEKERAQQKQGVVPNAELDACKVRNG